MTAPRSSNSDSNCLFCKIVEKRIPAKVVAEDEFSLAFRDINPAAPVHVLIVPKKHIATVNDAGDEDAETLGRLVLRAKAIAADLGLSKRGYRLVVNTNADAGQTVFHIHVHLLGGRAMAWPPG